MKKHFINFSLWLLSKILTVYGKTFRYRTTGKERLDALFASGKSAVFVTWHNQVYPILHFHRGVNLAIIISNSKDGDIVAKFAENFKYKAVRGSSSRNGAKALREITKLMDGTYHAAIAVDGPKGPKYKVKSGAVFLAKNTDKIIMPVMIECEHFKRFASWDGFILPYPFSKVTVHYCEPVYVSDDKSDEALSNEVEKLEKDMMEQSLVHSANIL